MTNDFQITHELADLPPEIWQYLKDHRFFAMIIVKRVWRIRVFLPMHNLVYCKKLSRVFQVFSPSL